MSTARWRSSSTTRICFLPDIGGIGSLGSRVCRGFGLCVGRSDDAGQAYFNHGPCARFAIAHANPAAHPLHQRANDVQAEASPRLAPFEFEAQPLKASEDFTPHGQRYASAVVGD